MPSVSIRIDDIDSQTSIEGLQILYRYLEEIDGICELSIIPFRNDASGNWLKSFLLSIKGMDRFQLSLHGHTHVKRTILSEFSGLSRVSQHDLIASGTNLLSSSNLFINKFVPPWNSYDENTLLACNDLGLKLLGTSYKQYIPSNTPLEVQCISADFQDFLRLPKFYDNFFISWHANLMFHTYDFKELHQSGSHSLHEIFTFIGSRKIKLTNHKDTNLDKLYSFNFTRTFRKKFPNKLTPSIFKLGKVI